MSRQRTVTTAIAALMLAPLAALAQRPGDTSRTSALCWTARPAPRCRAVLLTDLGAYVNAGSGAGPLFDDAGLMVNLGARDAVGVSVLVDWNSAVGVGPELRYRRWTRGGNALDLALGFRGPVAGVDHGAVIGLIKYNFGPYLGLTVRPVLESSPGVGLSFGVEIGSWPGALASAIVGVIKLSRGPHFQIDLASGGGPKW